jgi:translocator protein
MKINNFFRLVLAIIITNLAGILGSLFTAPSIDGWYKNINKPALNPPNWIFGPVWTTLFIMMGIALYLVWTAYTKTVDGIEKKKIKIALFIFAIQLALNTLWSILFFALESPFLALVGVVVLWLAILVTIITFYPISKVASYLLIPYILWVSFASYLNFSIWWLN